MGCQFVGEQSEENLKKDSVFQRIISASVVFITVNILSSGIISLSNIKEKIKIFERGFWKSDRGMSVNLLSER